MKRKSFCPSEGLGKTGGKGGGHLLQTVELHSRTVLLSAEHLRTCSAPSTSQENVLKTCDPIDVCCDGQQGCWL